MYNSVNRYEIVSIGNTLKDIVSENAGCRQRFTIKYDKVYQIVLLSSSNLHGLKNLELEVPTSLILL